MRPPDNLRIHLAGDVVGDFGQPLISPHLPLDVVLRCPLPTSAKLAACLHSWEVKANGIGGQGASLS